MSTPVNDCDVLLQASSTRYGAFGAGLLLTGSSPLIHTAVDGSSPNPATVTLTALQLGVPGTVTWTASGGTLTGSGNTRALAASSLTADVVLVTASVTYGGIVYSSSYAVARVRDGGTGTNGARGAGHYYATGSSWSDAVAAAACPGGVPIAGDVVTISNGGTYALEKVYTGSAWAAQGTVLDGSLLVTGSVKSAAIDTTNLTIRDSIGNVLFGAGTKIDWNNWIQNRPTSLAGINSTEGSKLSGVETGATNGATFGSNIFGQITAANVSTYIAAAAIGDAYIGNLSANKITAGSMSADRINGGTITGVSINIASGYFSVLSGGATSIASLYAQSPSFENAANPGIPACTVHGAGLTSGAALSVSNSGSGATGVDAAGNGYDFYASGAGTNYGPFTGAHDVLWPNAQDAGLVLGDIVVDVRCLARGGLSNTLFEVAPSSAPCQKAAIGVLVLRRGSLADTVPAVFITGRETTKQEADADQHEKTLVQPVIAPLYDEIKDTYQLGAVNALGEGQVNVCGKGGDLAAGDLIVTSSTPGKGMRQADDLLRSYTVARAREAVSFASPEEVKLVACVYLAG